MVIVMVAPSTSVAYLNDFSNRQHTGNTTRIMVIKGLRRSARLQLNAMKYNDFYEVRSNDLGAL